MKNLDKYNDEHHNVGRAITYSAVATGVGVAVGAVVGGPALVGIGAAVVVGAAVSVGKKQRIIILNRSKI